MVYLSYYNRAKSNRIDPIVWTCCFCPLKYVACSLMLDMKNEKFKDSTCPENVKEFISIYLFHLSTLDINKIIRQ